MKANFIQVEVKGGLGNQIFGLAAGWAVAVETGCNLLVNGSDIGWRGSNRSRTLELDLFDWSTFPNEIVFRSTRKNPNLGRMGNRLSTKLLQVVHDRMNEFERRDSPNDFRDIIDSALSGAILDGNYIDFDWLNLSRVYSFPVEFQLNQENSIRFEKKADTAVHIRLGDFLHYPDIFPIPSPHYYKTALRSLGSSKYDVFTDDEEHANRLFPELVLNANKVIAPRDYSGPETFVILGSYPKIIASASTYSSIAAWSIDSRGGKVVCPEKLILSQERDSRPDSWIRVGN
jgi:hypothetical protein